jgi:ketosteroid isomerase-like protein
MNLEAWSGFLDNTRTILKDYPVTPKTIIDCGDAENKVVVWATGEAQIKEELRDDGLSKEEWKFTGEYIIVFSWAEGGKLRAILEFTDSKGVEKFGSLMHRAGMNLQKSIGKQK